MLTSMKFPYRFVFLSLPYKKNNFETTNLSFLLLLTKFQPPLLRNEASPSSENENWRKRYLNLYTVHFWQPEIHINSPLMDYESVNFYDWMCFILTRFLYSNNLARPPKEKQYPVISVFLKCLLMVGVLCIFMVILLPTIEIFVVEFNHMLRSEKTK